MASTTLSGHLSGMTIIVYYETIVLLSAKLPTLA